MNELLAKVKENLILTNEVDDELLLRLIATSINYAESYQHLENGFYSTNEIQPTTEQAIIMLSSHFYESRDGSTGGFFADSINASKQIWNTVNRLLLLDREWKV